MGARRPSLTFSAMRGLQSVHWIAEASLESFRADGVRDREAEAEIQRGLEYIAALRAWYLQHHPEQCAREWEVTSE